MKWHPHSRFEGTHAFLSASNYHWLRYNNDKIALSYATHKAAELGTKLHAFADQAIKLKQKLFHNDAALNQYVSDCIDFGMDTEVTLFYSEYCYGTADAISFRDMTLRIFDLKTGASRVSFDQLLIYTALFCLEYGVDPSEITIELRIYQTGKKPLVYTPSLDEIAHVIDRIITANEIIENINLDGD